MPDSRTSEKPRFRKAIGFRVSRELVRRGMSETEFCAQIGIAKNSISYLKNGKRGGGGPQLAKIAKGLSWTLDQLTAESDAKPTDAGEVEKLDYGPDYALELLPEIESYIARKGETMTDEDKRVLRVFASVDRRSGVPLDDPAIDKLLLLLRELRERYATKHAPRGASGAGPTR